MRDDIFIIWGNGVNYLEDIANIIRIDYDKIYYIIRHDIVDMEKFIKDVYKCDTVPWPHLIAKSRYLLKAPKYCYSIYIQNNAPEEKYYGEGKFRHIQCSRIKATKEKVRDKFNPKHPNGNRTEEHVIHGTDYEEQVLYLRKFLRIPDKNKINETPNGSNVTINLNDIYCNILGKGIIPIKKSPHYMFVKDPDTDVYRDYIMKYIGKELIHDHLPDAYIHLMHNFDVDKCDDICAKKIDGKIVILDGLHRSCILLKNGIEEFGVRVC